MSSAQSESKFNTVIVRFGGEIGIKASWTRRLYERRLISNITAALKQQSVVYEALNRKFGRLYVRTPDAERTCKTLTRVFGVTSVSPAIVTTSGLGDIIESSVLAAASTLRKGAAFAVRCRRVGSHTYTSQDVCRHVGQALLDAYHNRELHVDLKHPDITLEVEVREDQAYVYMKIMKGPGGLPLGTQPRIIGLLNGDINSLVACWMVMKRGCPITPLHFAETPSMKTQEKRMLEAAKTLVKWAPGFPRKVHIISPEAGIAKISIVSSKTLKNLLTKRLMFRIVEKLAEKWQAEGIVTGDVLQKPAKESLHTYRISDEASQHLPIHRPLIGLEDSEIVEIARRIGIEGKLSFKTEGREKPLNSVGKTSLETVKAAETKVRMDELVEMSLESLRTVAL